MVVPFIVYAVSAMADPDTTDGPAVAVAVVATAAVGVGRARQLRGRARARDASTQSMTAAFLEYEARGERARIARELHDVVAHHISMIAVQAETARLTTPGMPRRRRAAAARHRRHRRTALTEMRRLLGVLREDTDTEHDPPAAARPAPAHRAGRRRPSVGRRDDAARRPRRRRAARPGRRAHRVPDRAGGADQRPPARARRGRRRGARLRRGRAAASGCGTTARDRPVRSRPTALAGGHGLLGMRERAAPVGGDAAGRLGAGRRLPGRGHPPGSRTRTGDESPDEPRLPVRIVVVDDQEVVRAGFAALLDTQPDFTVVGTAADGAEARAALPRPAPRRRAHGRAHADHGRHRGDPRGITAEASDGRHPARVLILTTFDLDEHVYDALERRRQRLPAQGRDRRAALRRRPGRRRRRRPAGARP